MKINDMIFNVAKQDNKAVIEIDGNIGEFIDFVEYEINAENTVKGIKNKIKALGDVDEIEIQINSVGGSLNHGVGIHDLLASLPQKKTVKINGMTASAATIIAMAGDTIKMSDNAFFLIHRASMPVWGNFNDFKSAMEDLKMTDDVIANIYKKRTKNNKNDIISLMDENAGNGIWLNAKTAKKLGYIDEVFEPSKEKSNLIYDQLKENRYIFNSIKLPEIETEVDLLKKVEDLLNNY